MNQPIVPRRALISVSDKSGVVDFARGLSNLGFELLSTGGTARTLRESGLTVVDVSECTGFPEIMGGRVKTLHPMIHGGILGRRGTDDAVMAEHGIAPIEIVAVNLYPFEATISRPDCTRADAVEQIDIGGPAMVRAAAKNHAHVTIVVEPADYRKVLEELESSDAITEASRRSFAAKAFAHTAAYDAAIAAYLVEAESGDKTLPAPLNRQWQQVQELRYGENPHQAAALYRDRDARPDSLAGAEPLQGKALSYNNLADADSALGCVSEFDLPACVIVKHANPCGVAEAKDLVAAYDAAFACDPTSAFGGIIAFNRPVEADLAQRIIDRQFVEVLAAPAVSEEALAVLATKPNIRVLAAHHAPAAGSLMLKSIGGGLLVQDEDQARIELGDLRVVSRRQARPGELEDLLFAWRVVKHVRSNAIVLAGDSRTLGIGAGQMSRVMSVRIAGWKLGELAAKPSHVVMASDAFFPFRDGIDEARKSGVSAVIQPGGSKRDDEVIAAADEHDMLMVMTGFRHFRH